MMKGILRSCAGLASIFAATGYACEWPPLAVTIPDGEAASIDRMLEAQQEVKAYRSAMEEYLACIEEEINEAGKDATALHVALMDRRYNTAVAELEAVAGAYNEQLQAYREANPPEEE